MSHDPFSEPEDDRTIIRPMPGGTRGMATDQRALATGQRPACSSLPTADLPPIYAVGTSPLLAVAEPLILLLARLWNAPTKPFSGDLRDTVVRAMRVFEQRAKAAGVKMEHLRPCHYALCASIDDVVRNTPWGGAAGWEAGSLTATFHQEASSGQRFFDQLAKLCRDPAEWLPVIEVMYICLSLGFMGPYRRIPDGADVVERVRKQTHAAIIRQRPPAGPELSPHWAGVAAPYTPDKARFPVWVTGSLALAIMAGLFVWCMVALDAASDDVYARMLGAPPSTMPRIVRAALIRPPPPSPALAEPGAIDRLRAALQPDIDQHLLAILGSSAAVVVRINTGSMFASGSATLQPGSTPLLEHIASVLKAEVDRPGATNTLQVNGYTDNQPIRTVKFPSNFKLSSSRAEAVRDVLQRIIGKAPAIEAEGRADADPVATNATASGREQNRRIEIVLRRQT